MNNTARWLAVLTCLMLITLASSTLMLAGPSKKDPPPSTGPGIYPLPEPLVALNSDPGRKLLSECRQSRCFWPLMLHFETQDTGAFCGPASAVMCLNASGIRRPASSAHPGFLLVTQKDYVHDLVEQNIAPDVAGSGMTLRQFARGIEAHGLKVETHHAGDEDAQAFKDRASRALHDGDFVVVNYNREKIPQVGKGHISVIAAYNDHAEGIFLLLDVARYKYEPHWIPTNLMHAAMNTLDGSVTRGYVVISRPAAGAKYQSVVGLVVAAFARMRAFAGRLPQSGDSGYEEILCEMRVNGVG